MSGLDHQPEFRDAVMFSEPVHAVVGEGSGFFSEQGDGSPSPEIFLRLYLRYENRLRAFILSALANPSETDDLLQETALILWQKFEEFEIGTDFFAWACRIAQFRVLKYYERQRRSRIRFGQEVLEALGEEVSSMGTLLEARQRVLAGCINELRPRDRDLLQRRYVQEESPREIAGQVGRSVASVYKTLARIRDSLMACIQSKLAGEI